MGTSTYSVSEAQRALPRLVREAEGGELVAIARRDETVAYLVSREHLEAIVETMEPIECIFAERRSVVYELLLERLRDRLKGGPE